MILQGGQSDLAKVEEAIKHCRDFLAQVNLIVGAETDEWAQNFQKALIELEKRTREKSDNSSVNV
jgi:hypothetical protein